jgi:hypothetical protein
VKVRLTQHLATLVAQGHLRFDGDVDGSVEQVQDHLARRLELHARLFPGGPQRSDTGAARRQDQPHRLLVDVVGAECRDDEDHEVDMAEVSRAPQQDLFRGINR